MADFLLGFCTSAPSVPNHGPYMCEIEWAFVIAGLSFTVIYVVSLLFLAYMDNTDGGIGHLP
jgi:hypothetical protein